MTKNKYCITRLVRNTKTSHVRNIWLVLVAGSLLLSGCWNTSTPAPDTTKPAPPSPEATTVPLPTLPVLGPDDPPVLISEVMAGKQGNNNFEFIELYNRSGEAFDLQGWALWYRLPTSKEDLFVYRWTTSALVPPQGHYLLALKDQEIGILPDGEYEQPLNLNGGGLQLRQTDGKVRDQMGWGNAPAGFYDSQPAPALINGQSLERLPGGTSGSGLDSGDNSQDFRLVSAPEPQNTGSVLAPLPAMRLEVSVTAPETATPGSSFDYTFTVSNLTGQDLQGVTVTIPMPVELAIPDAATGMKLEMKGSPAQPVITWQAGILPKDSEQSATVSVMVPYTYFTAVVRNYSAQAENWATAAYGGVVRTRIEGGVIPIGTARTLLGAEMTIEGIATMYTGGYFAGAGNNKFYLQDETGGIQVQVFGGQGAVNVKIGDRVRVRGDVSVYRGSVQIVPISVPDDVQVLEPAADPAPVTASIQESLTQPETLPGKLVQVQGDITRVEEFTYSYEIDLLGAVDSNEPASITLYVDKQAGINVEEFVAGQQMTAVGILDLRDTTTLLYPRRQSDLAQRYPEILRIEASAPNNVQPGELFTVTLTLYNHLDQSAAPVLITSTLPANTTLQSVLDGGSAQGALLEWQIPSLSGDGAAMQVHYLLRAAESTPTGQQAIQIESYGASAPQAEQTAQGPAFYTFIGDGVPVWAVQGSGARSPYSGRVLTTQGVVTGIFPDLGGFFIQEKLTDEDPATSAGLFVQTGILAPADFTKAYPELSTGVEVRVYGKVREPSQQTIIEVLGPQDVTILAADQPLPAPVALNPPASMAEALPYFEALEGMYVTISGPALAVAPISKYGEYVVVLPEHNQSRLFQGEDNGIMIMVDDGSSITHADSASLPYLVSTGDQVNGLAGPLAYTYGRFKIEPITMPQVTPGATEPAVLEPAGEDEFTLMTWNVENLFDTQDPHPADPPKPRLVDYQRHLDKVASTIAAAGFPSIIGLQEVENIRVLNDLAAHALLAGYDYQAVLFEGDDSRGIDVGFLVRADQATILDAEARPAPDGLFSRPPLVLHVEVNTADGTAELYVINNHFVSMSGGEEATEPRRTAQAAWNVELVEEILLEHPHAWVAVIGDLNSFFNSAPIQALRNGALQHAMDSILPEERYTYIYQGESQVLDHILLTPTLMSQMVRLQVLHTNSDYPLPAPDDATPRHKSDHDPVVATFSMKAR